jgi:hypothetical protein
MDNLTFQQSLLFFVLGAFGQKDGSAACFPRILLCSATSQTHTILRLVVFINCHVFVVEGDDRMSICRDHKKSVSCFREPL